MWHFVRLERVKFVAVSVDLPPLLWRGDIVMLSVCGRFLQKLCVNDWMSGTDKLSGM